MPKNTTADNHHNNFMPLVLINTVPNINYYNDMNHNFNTFLIQLPDIY